MNLIFESPQIFFYRLLQDSKKLQNINLAFEVDQYIVDLLSQITYSNSMIELENSLVLKFLEAKESSKKQELKICADSSLYILGFLPDSKPELNSVYYDIGPAAYSMLGKKIYIKLSVYFERIVEALVGLNSLLIQEKERLLSLWWTTSNKVTKHKLEESGIFLIGTNNNGKNN